MKILVINCGSSSLKYQLIDMQGEKVLCKGLCERIGMESSMITHEANGNKATTPAIFPTHTEAFAEVVKKMTTGDGKVIDDVSEINAIGHRVVHGGEKFQASCLITPEVIETLRELSPLAPLHNPAGCSCTGVSCSAGCSCTGAACSAGCSISPFNFWPQFGQKSASSPTCVPQFPQNAIFIFLLGFTMICYLLLCINKLNYFNSTQYFVVGQSILPRIYTLNLIIFLHRQVLMLPVRYGRIHLKKADPS